MQYTKNSMLYSIFLVDHFFQLVYTDPEILITNATPNEIRMFRYDFTNAVILGKVSPQLIVVLNSILNITEKQLATYLREVYYIEKPSNPFPYLINTPFKKKYLGYGGNILKILSAISPELRGE